MIPNQYDVVGAVTSDMVTDQRMQKIFTYFENNGLHTLLIGHNKSQSQTVGDYSFDQKRITTFFNKGPIFYLEYNIRLILILMTLKVRNLYAADLDTLLAVGLVGKLKRSPYIFDSHELFTEVPELEGRFIKKRIWLLIGRLFIKGAKKRITVGKTIATNLSEKYKAEFQIIKNYPTLKALDVQKNNNSKIILYQGKLNQGRGISQMIEAMDHLPDELHLWIIGDGDLYEDLKQTASLSSSKKRIIFKGELKPSELHSITQKAWLGLNLLDTKSKSYYLSAANKVYDYIMAGIPFLTMNFPEYRTLNESYDISYLIDSLDASEIVMAIKDILDNESNHAIKKQKCQSVRNELNWESESQKLDPVIEILNDHS